jgi:protein-S-isoprenylcysteine O-methyltransferase Ste14
VGTVPGIPSLSRNIAISTLFTLFGGPGLVLVVLPWLLTHFRVPPHAPAFKISAAWIVIGAGLVPLFESIVRFIVVGHGTLVPAAPPEHLVITGLYRHVRNPMYVGVMTVLCGEALLLARRNMVLLGVLVWVAMDLFVRFYEEPHLMRRFPAEYGLYRRHVRRWLPRLTPWNSPTVSPKGSAGNF